MKKLILSLLAVVMCISAVGCKDDSGDSDSSSKSVSVNLAANPPELNTMLTTDSVSGNVLRHVVEGLTKLDNNNDAPIPAIAKEWTVSDDNLTYEFTLREDAKWSNGEPVTANDFVFAWTQVLTKANAAEYSYMCYVFKNAEKFYNGECGIEDVGFKVEGDYKLVVTLEQQVPYFLSQLSFYTFAPINEKTFNEMGGFDKYGKEADQMVYNGAFVIDEWVHEDHLTIKKNADYYDADKVGLDEVKFLMIKDANAALNAFLADEVDFVSITGTQRQTVEANGIDIENYSDGSSWYFEYNTKNPVLSNAKIRKALTMAIDKESFIKNVVSNDSIVAVNFTNPCIIGYDGNSFSEEVGPLIKTDFTEAKKLLEEGLAEEGLSVSDLNGLEYITDDTTSAAKYAAFFQSQWKENLGFEVEIVSMPFKSRVERMQSKDFDIVMAGWGPDYNDPMTFLDIWVTDGGNNHTSWSNAKYDECIQLAAAETDYAKRQEYFVECEKLLADECPIGVIYNRMVDYVKVDGLTGVYRSPFQDLDLTEAQLS